MSDGPTHHGLFDISYLRCLPNVVAMAPKDEDERADTDCLFNMETITGYEHREELARTAGEPSGVQGIVFGRVAGRHAAQRKAG